MGRTEKKYKEMSLNFLVKENQRLNKLVAKLQKELAKKKEPSSPINDLEGSALFARYREDEPEPGCSYGGSLR